MREIKLKEIMKDTENMTRGTKVSKCERDILEAMCYGTCVASCALGFASEEAQSTKKACLKMLWMHL